nr:PREDICTED: protein FAM169B-like [Lepisosteus oculatus]
MSFFASCEDTNRNCVLEALLDQQVKIEQSNVSRLSLFGDDDPAHAVLALLRPENKTQVLALYLDGTWWPLDDVLKTSDPSRAGLVTGHLCPHKTSCNPASCDSLCCGTAWMLLSDLT